MKPSRFITAFLMYTGVQAFVVGGADLDARIKALPKKVKGSLRPLKAGTFEMGDWGDASGRHYDMEPYSRPLHKVTLDGYSMMAYKVTYEDFDVLYRAMKELSSGR